MGIAHLVERVGDLGQQPEEIQDEETPDGEGDRALGRRQPALGVEQAAHPVDDHADRSQCDQHRRGDGKEERRADVAAVNEARECHEREPRHRKDDAREARVQPGILLRGAVLAARAQRPALDEPRTGEAHGDESEVDPAMPRRQRGFDAVEVDRFEHDASLPSRWVIPGKRKTCCTP